jgi:hypothetical protein
MNRIILIGNGFDLAHGMKTSYNDFIIDYWERTCMEITKSNHGQKFENKEFIISKSPSGFFSGKTYRDLEKNLSEIGSKIEFKNRFLKDITEKSYINKWVDVENEYYFLLKKAYNATNRKSNHYNIIELNSDFNAVKGLLREYLIRVEENFNNNMGTDVLRMQNIIGHKVYRPFDLKDFSEQSLNQKAELEYEFIRVDMESLKLNIISMNELAEDKQRLISKIGKKDPLKEIKRILQSGEAMNYFDLIPDQTLFLNFNYTFTDFLYANPHKFNQFNDKKYSNASNVHIHGSTNENDRNPIIFGFGDELDEDYKSIEKLNDNSYLENIKSINYLETDNYKRLLEFANIGNFQVFIFGHSCGISDRTLLNTIFEHDNCASIKPFYHLRKNNEDNYSDIVRNVSRNFNDKAKMRDRVVNKTYCESLR